MATDMELIGQAAAGNVWTTEHGALLKAMAHVIIEQDLRIRALEVIQGRTAKDSTGRPMGDGNESE